MRRSSHFVSLLAFTCLSSTLGAQGPVERQLRRLEEEWIRAVVQRDGPAFRRLLLPSFVYTENALVMTRDELIREVTTGTDTVASGANEDMKVIIHGNTGVVTGILVLRGRGKDGPFERRFRYTDTWVRSEGRWRVLAAQDYLLP